MTNEIQTKPEPKDHPEAITLSYSPAPKQVILDWPGWSVAIGGGVAAGVLIGTSINGYHAMIAGAAIALLVALVARTRPVGKALIGNVLAVASCLTTITLDKWCTGSWRVGYVSDHMFRIGIFLLLSTCGPGAIVSLLACAVRRAVAACIRWSRSAVPSVDER